MWFLPTLSFVTRKLIFLKFHNFPLCSMDTKLLVSSCIHLNQNVCFQISSNGTCLTYPDCSHTIMLPLSLLGWVSRSPVPSTCCHARWESQHHNESWELQSNHGWQWGHDIPKQQLLWSTVLAPANTVKCQTALKQNVLTFPNPNFQYQSFNENFTILSLHP